MKVQEMLSKKVSLSFLLAVVVVLGMTGSAAYAVADVLRPSVVFTGTSTALVSGKKVELGINAYDASGIDRMAINIHDADRDFVLNCGNAVRNLSNEQSHTYTCKFDSTRLPNGAYEVRAGARDENGLNRTIFQWITIQNETSNDND
jgi:hypothetical protein